MTRRRTFLLGGAATLGLATVGGLAATDRLDDLAREMGIDPVPRPADSDRAVLTAAAADTSDLLAVAAALSPTVTALLTEHLEVLGGAPDSTTPSAPDAVTARARFSTSAATRRRQAVEAVSPDLARTLGSMAVLLGLVATGVVS